MRRFLLGLGVLGALVPCGCESCGFSFGSREPRVVLELQRSDGLALAEPDAAAIVAAARIEVCRVDHDGADCEEFALEDAIDSHVQPASRTPLDVGLVVDGGAYERRTQCYFPGISLEISAPGCTSVTHATARVRAEHDDAPEPEIVLAFTCTPA